MNDDGYDAFGRVPYRDWDKGYQSGYNDAVTRHQRDRAAAQKNGKPAPSSRLVISVHYADGTHKTERHADDENARQAIRETRASGAIVYVTRIETTITPDAL